ncbi:adenosine deaminase family protein [Ruania alba]|uniref:Adenosine deaminase n=1 Tax=Ruania alba TaxID=648782 RepID=A0A1H5NI19_9MICO|nr:hypothetical protein [Ruania alba]SEF00511.1 adenosine deaminase [Ruania alba]
MPTLAEFCERVPKAEVHCHFVGAIPAEVAWRIAARNDVPLPADGPATLYRFDNFHQFIDRYMTVATALRRPADFAEAVYAVLQDGAEHGNVRYRELFFNPTDHHHASYPDMLTGLLDGIAAAETDLGVRCRLVPSINRMQSPQIGVQMVEQVVAHRRDEVIGIGLDASEPAGPPELFAEAFAIAGRAGLRRTAHACEDYAGLDGGPPRNATTCLDLLGCDRLDHGYNILADEAVVQRCRDAGVPFTCCLPGSNPVLRPARIESIRTMLELGLPVSLHSDDPAMHGANPGEVYTFAAEVLGLGIAEVGALALAAVDATWLDDTERSALRSEFQAEIDRLAGER